MHAPAPAQAPVHATRFEPGAGVAVTVIDVPSGKLAVHVVPQSIPAGVVVTDPGPVTVTDSLWTVPPPPLPVPVLVAGPCGPHATIASGRASSQETRFFQLGSPVIGSLVQDLRIEIVGAGGDVLVGNDQRPVAADRR